MLDLNHNTADKKNYINYLYQEGVRARAHKNPSFYKEIIEFVNSEEGKEGLNKFSQTDKRKLGITTEHIKTTIKRVFN